MKLYLFFLYFIGTSLSGTTDLPSKPENNQTIKVVVYAGETKEELTSRLSKATGIPKAKLIKSYNALSPLKEAGILAQHYTIPHKADAHSTMKYIFLKSQQRLKLFQKRHFKRTLNKKELNKIHTMASIIQKETNDKKEMPLIASVIENRLKKGMKLQLDGSLNYGKYSHTVITPKRIREDKSIYNTYKIKGLPPHPICSVSLDALKACATPSKTKYLYFMLNHKGKHDFSTTYKEHARYISAYKKKKSNSLSEKKKSPYKIQFETNTVKIDWGKVSL